MTERSTSSLPQWLIVVFALAAVALAMLLGCENEGPSRTLIDGGQSPVVDGSFRCISLESQACLENVHHTCVPESPQSEFLKSEQRDCTAEGLVCVEPGGCLVCRPGTFGCDQGFTAMCRADGSGWDRIEECVLADGLACRDGQCVNLCDEALAARSYQGCEFYAADLDNAALELFTRDASSQVYAVVVSNPGVETVDVVVELNEAAPGEEPRVVEVDARPVPPGDLEVFELPRREVDGSSSNTICSAEEPICPGTEVCVCEGGPPCYCRIAMDATGLNDGTHSALTANAYRVRSNLPIVAYQFNPLENAGVFSNDASLLLPTSALGERYTVVAWPQTIADAECDPDDPSCQDVDFDPGADDEGLRSFLTIVGTKTDTEVKVTFGTRVQRVVAGGPIPELGNLDIFQHTLGPFEVLNFETQWLNADFTGTVIEASKAVSVFVGSEASDVPRFDTYATRQCCADHLEEQLFPDTSLGRSFIISKMPRRTVSLNRAFLNPAVDAVIEPPSEAEWVRVVAVEDGETVVSTTLPPPNDRMMLLRRESVLLEATQDFLLDANRAVAVLQALPSQQEVGIPSEYPGGDPAIIAVPPIEQYRADYVFLTPDKYAFDYVTITANASTTILLDGQPLRIFDRNVVPDEVPRQPYCWVAPADGIPRMLTDPPPEQVIYRCQLSFPDVVGQRPLPVEDGDQYDGVHTILADQPVGIIVYGFDAFVSYAYAGGLNLTPLN